MVFRVMMMHFVVHYAYEYQTQRQVCASAT